MMITKLLKLRSILRDNQDVNMTLTLKKVGLKRKDLETLVRCNVIEKTGSTKGANWHWIGSKPTNEAINNWFPLESITDDYYVETEGTLTFGSIKKEEPPISSLLDVVFRKFNLNVTIKEDVNLSFDGQNKVVVTRRRPQGNVTTEVTDASSLDSILKLLT